MKLGLIVLSIVIGLFVGTGYALATTHVPVATASDVKVPTQDMPVVIELPADSTYTVPTVTIVGSRTHHKAVASAKTWQCGEVYENAIGGHNSDCVWR